MKFFTFGKSIKALPVSCVDTYDDDINVNVVVKLADPLQRVTFPMEIIEDPHEFAVRDIFGVLTAPKQWSDAAMDVVFDKRQRLNIRDLSMYAQTIGLNFELKVVAYDMTRRRLHFLRDSILPRHFDNASCVSVTGSYAGVFTALLQNSTIR